MNNIDLSELYHDYIKTFLFLYTSICLVFSYVLNRFLLRFIKTLGSRNTESLERWSEGYRPAIGGIGFFMTFLISSLFFSVLFDGEDLFMNQSYLGLLLASSLAFLLGLSDDAYNTRPVIKLFTQIFCGILIVSSGNVLELFSNESINIAITVLWVVGFMNSINMLDNMDGVSGVTSVFILLSAGTISYFFAYLNTSDAFIVLGILGALIGFLIMNKPPSKIFMGDTGAMFLGVLLSFFGIKYIGNIHTMTSHLTSIHSTVLLLTVFLIPIADTVTVFIIRILKGRSPLIGGKDHTTHALVYKGWSEMKVNIFIVAVGIVNTGWTLLYLTNKINEIAALFWVNILYLILLSSSLFYNTWVNQNE